MVNGGPGPAFVDGDLYYLPCRENGTFRIYDLSVLTAVVQVGQVTTGDGWGRPYKIGRYVYIVAGGGLRTIDVSNPAAPVIVNTLPLPGNDLLISRNGKLFVLGWTQPVVRAFSLANPAAPVIEASSTVSFSGATSVYLPYLSLWGEWVGDSLAGMISATPSGREGLWVLDFEVN